MVELRPMLDGLLFALLLARAPLGNSSQAAAAESPRARVPVAPACDARGDADADVDGLPDDCEFMLAKAFAPELLADPADCAWVRDAAGPRLGGGYFFAVEPIGRTRSTVRIAYLPAYFRDCGWRGVQRLIRFGRSNAHAGDSELIVIDAARGSDGQWRTVGVFLSAHCSGRSDGRCRWYRGAELSQFEWTNPGARVAPRVWVARDKHANYPSRAACESGHWHQERCAPAPVSYRFPVAGSAHNIGSREVPAFRNGGCIAGGELPGGPTGAMAAAVECMWREDGRFTGWQGPGQGSADGYGSILGRFAGM